MFDKKYLNILRELTVTDFKLKYSRSALGFAWSLLKPFLMLATLYIVFHILLKLDVAYYELFLLLGIVLWGFFSEATTFSMNNFLAKGGMIKKLHFPVSVIVVSSCLNAFISLLLNLAVFFIFLLIVGISITWHILFFALILAEFFILSLGFAYGLTAFFVRFRDLSHIWEVLLQVGFWVSPIIYPVASVPPKYISLYMLNPVARVINDSRNALIYHGPLPSLLHITISLILCASVYFFGLLIFRRMSPKFAEEI